MRKINKTKKKFLNKNDRLLTRLIRVEKDKNINIRGKRYDVSIDFAISKRYKRLLCIKLLYQQTINFNYSGKTP